LPGADTVKLDKSLNTSKLTSIFAYSPSFLPKPIDWPSNYHVTGQMNHKTSNDYHPLPKPLQEYLDNCRMSNFHVIYVGFGSLGFFPPNKVTEILSLAAKAVEELAKSMPIRAVIQMALSSTPGKNGRLSISSTQSTSNGTKNDAFFTFDDTVDHKALFPQVSLVVSHGGVGTIQTALSSGKPVLSMCCLPTSDQSFWADLASRRKLGPQYFWVKDLTLSRMMKGLKDGVLNLEEYTQNAENMAKAMALEDGISMAAQIVEEEARFTG
jgi:sterol 3beta-glucosyltransferase